MEEIINLCKRRGFVWQGSDIYGGVAGLYDFGPYGTLLLNNIKAQWRRANVQLKENYVEIDSAMFKEPKVWVASGHVGGFSDPLSECKVCHTRVRVDKELGKIGVEADEKMTDEELNTLWGANCKKIKCPVCGNINWTKAQMFNLLVKSNLGDFTDKGESPVYLPGEACQGIYLNYKNIVDTCRVKIPFGVAQIGKAFRNEISPRNFLFRCREFEQADTQYFVKPHENEEAYQKIKQERFDWYLGLGIKKKNLRLKQHTHLVFYANDAWDIEYNFPSYGFDEVEGIHDRTDYDLTQHMKYSGVDLSYVDSISKEKYIPWILETSAGVGRMFLAFLSDAYTVEELAGGGKRTVLKLDERLAPIKFAVFPLLKNKPELVKKARAVYAELSKKFVCEFDDNGNIGKRYRRQDEIGTPKCVVVDFQTLEDGTLAVRDRDTMEQTRVRLEDFNFSPATNPPH
ncbi:MAG: glycine--tRNA ligase [Candidatus Nomurabacteria bacterium]|jgi:glycyl-tRNA synthetase|nr:glycine--tRNA ligase [Candidatus Nomurabacteria bacterium]